MSDRSNVGDNLRESKNDPLSLLRIRLEAESSDSLKLLRSIKDNPICSVTFDESIPCVVVIWKRYATRAQLRFVHESILRLLETHGVNKILGDDTGLATIHAEDQSWIVRDWMPRAIAAGLKFACCKIPVSHFGKVAERQVQYGAPRGLTLRAFDSVDDAKRWLKSAPVC